MTRTETKSRQKIAAENMTDVQRLMRALQSGRLKSELRTAQEAIHAARALAVQIGSTLNSPGFAKHFKNPKYAEHYHVAVAYMTPDLSMLFTEPYTPGKELELQQRLSGPGTCCIPVGLVFGIRDTEGPGWYSGARPFLETPLVIMALKQRLEDQNTIGIH